MTLDDLHDLEPLSSLQRQRHTMLESLVRRAVREVIEYADGFTLRFPRRERTWMVLAEFVNLERQCFTHLSYGLELEIGQENVWLQVTGDAHAVASARRRWLLDPESGA